MTKQNPGQKTHHTFLVAVLAGLPALAMLGLAPSTGFAQYRTGQNGHANDANPQVGSGGFNGGGNTGLGRGNNDAVNTNIITGQVGGLDYFHSRNNREINPNVIDTFTGTAASDRLNAIAGGVNTAASGGTGYESRLGTTPGVTPFYSTNNYLGTPPPGIALAPTATGQGLIAAPRIDPLTPSDDARNAQANDLNNNPSIGNIQNPGEIDVLGGPVDPSGNSSISSMSPLYGIRGMQMGNAGDTFYQSRYGQAPNSAANPAGTPQGAPGSDTSPNAVQKMRDEMNKSTSPDQSQSSDKPVPGAVTVGQQALNSSVGTSTALPGSTLNSSVSSQSLAGGISNGEGNQSNILVPASKQSPQLKALEQRYDQNKSKMNDVQRTQIFNQEHKLAQQNSAMAKPANPDQPVTDPTITGVGNPTPGMKPDEKPQDAPSKVLGDTPTLSDKPIIITSLATGIPAKGLADLMKSAEDGMRQGKFTEAVDSYETAQHAFPNNPLIYMGRSFAELGSSYYGKADLDLRRAVLIDPAVLSGRYDLNGFLGQDRVTFVQKELTDIQSHEKGGRAPLLLAFIAHNVGDDASAATELNEAATRGGYSGMVDEMRSTWGIKAPAPAPK